MKDIKKLIISLICFALSILSGLFSFVYELNSNAVYSNAIIFLFCYPLIGGLIYLILYLTNKKLCWFSECLFNSGISFLWIWNSLFGVLEIYGKTVEYIKYFIIVGIMLINLSVIAELILLVYLKLRKDCFNDENKIKN